MPKYSKRSKAKLETCHPDLRKIYNEVIKCIDVTILEGIRTFEQQEEYLRKGFSQTMKSKHLPQSDGYSHAVDAAPYPIIWDDKLRFCYYQGIVKGIAHILYKNKEIGHRTRHGIDWDGDGDIKEHKLFDGPHVELKK